MMEAPMDPAMRWRPMATRSVCNPKLNAVRQPRAMQERERARVLRCYSSMRMTN